MEQSVLIEYPNWKEKLSNPSPHTYIKRPKSKHRKKSQWVRKDSWVGRIIIFGVIMFTISKGFAVIFATKNLHLPFIKDIFASGLTRFLEWVVSENQGKVETEKMKKWLQKRGGFESDKVVVMKTEYGGLGDDAKTMTHFAEELSSIKKDVATLVATVARMDESLSKIMSELSSKNEEKERTLRTPCPHELEVKQNKEDNNIFNMGSDGGQKDLGNAKPPKSRPNKEDGTPNEQDDNVKGFATVDKTLAPSVEVIRERKHAKQPHNEEGAKFVRPSDRMTSCARTHKLCRLARFNGRLKDCMQIYIPMHDDVMGHWYLLVCDIFHKKVEIWDSLPYGSHNKKRENDCHISLLYLDSVFHDDILSVFGTGWTFSSFSVVSPLDANPIQPNGVDCGIFVIRHMQYYRQLWYDRYDSNVQRMRLAIELLRNEKNQLRDAIIREELKVMENGSDFMAKGNKIGNVEVKDKDVADVTVRKKRVYIRKQKNQQ
ncbi:hypothetical protein L3X38_025033 [Prunus dulcis]|uniref:Ubiquitin-like protease family profile domain-containing protein n=1 Tax=Prunus dulcis TaxID=3755 RepID=A0AAD4Z6P9_PRUDU|nr:hypothetical protein L3X38_025033 [Prunus dulcis]